MTEDKKSCPVCGEEIWKRAKKCIHCDSSLGWTGFKGKTAWDWMSLLIVPIVLAAVGLTFSLFETQRQNAIEDRRATAQAEAEDNRATAQAETEDNRATAQAWTEQDRSRETVLQNYLDEMTELLLDRDLRNSRPGDEVWILAQARTVTTLRQLDVLRMTTLMNFLRQAGLVDRDDSIQILRGADISGAWLYKADLYRTDLRETNLGGVVLSQADLRGADLEGANLEGANLREADLHGADLFRAYLSGADLLRADLSGANLLRADLYGANLEGANLEGANPEEAIYDDNTVWPEGFSPPADAINIDQ